MMHPSVLENHLHKHLRLQKAPVILDLAQAPKKNGPVVADMNNFTGSMTEDANRYDPLKGRVDLTTPGYV
jgi:hypothetical protein